MRVENARPIPRHQHVLWTFETPAGPPVQLGFVDPRRFGGVHLAADARPGEAIVRRLDRSHDDRGP